MCLKMTKDDCKKKKNICKNIWEKDDKNMNQVEMN